MAKLLDFFGASLRRPAQAAQWMGSSGFTIYAGLVDTEERSPKLASHESLYRTYSDILSNTSIVAASVRYYLNLISKAEWSFEPSEADTDGEYAERLEEILMSDPLTPWHRIVRRASMYRFYGFSVQEWRVRRREDGWLTFHDIRPRPQATIERWDVDEDGIVVGMIQRRPQDQQYLYLPRAKTLYMIDDSLTDAPSGLGLFRHLVSPSDRLARYEQLEGFGFEIDLRNIPVGRIPYRLLQEAVENNKITQEQANNLIKPLEDFVKNHVKSPRLGLVVDSSPYEGTTSEGERPSTIEQYGLDLLSGSQTSLPESAKAIERLNREIARILGTEQLMLGSDTTGSYALSKDKTGQFYLIVDSGLTEVRETIETDLIDMIWALNGWPEEMKPETRTEAIRSRDIEEIAAALRDLATAGAPLMPDDPVIPQLRDLMGVERPVEDPDMLALLDGITGNEPDPDDPGNEPPMPRNDE